MRPNKPPRPELRSPRDIALGLLARREHSRQELRGKLISRECDVDEVEELLDVLASEGLQSEERYAESYVYSRKSRGYGPLRILAELRQRGVEDSVSQGFLDATFEEWLEIARSQYVKKFGHQVPEDFEARIKPSRYMQNRGFSTEIIRSLLNSLE